MSAANWCNNLARMTVGPFRERGAFEALRSIYVSSYARIRERGEDFDGRFGTDTTRRFTMSSLSVQGDDVVPLWRYFGTLEQPFRKIMAALDVDERTTTFVDMGCGKGRALLMASERPFRRIVGVELSPALVEVARRNVAVYRSPEQRCHAFELVRADAAEWEPPAEELVIYLFQPFPAPVMIRMLDNLERSIAANPRRVTIAYYHPLYGDLVTRSGRFAMVASGAPSQKGEFRWAVYSHGER